MTMGWGVFGWNNPEDVIANLVEIIGLNGKIVVRNSHGAIIMWFDATGFFAYEDLGSATQGTLVMAIVVQATPVNDPVFSNPENPGLNGIDPAFGDSISVLGANINLSAVPFTRNGQVTAAIAGGSAGPSTLVNSPEQGTSGHSQMQILGSTATEPGGFLFAQNETGITNATRMTNAPIEIQETGGNILTAGSDTLFVPVGGILINTTTFTQIVFTWNGVAGATYEIDCLFWYSTGSAAGIPEFKISGSATATANKSNFQLEAKQTGVTSFTGQVDTPSAFGVQMNAPGMTGAGTTYVITIRGSINVATAGTIQLQAAVSNAADNYTILAASMGTISRTG